MSAGLAPNIPNIARLIRELLDKGFETAARATLNAIAAQGGVMKLRLEQLEAEATRLADTGQKLTADNPVLRAVLADFQEALNAAARRLDDGAEQIQQSGINAANVIAPTVTLAGLQVRPAWNQPDPNTIIAVVNYSAKPAWQRELNKFQEGAWLTARDTALREIALGKGPIAVARSLRRVITDLPISKANTIARTLQLASQRQATAVHYRENERILSGQMRIAVLDRRTCLSCVALHGTILPVGTVISDHHNGRCTSVGIVRGRERAVQTGVDWFEGLGEAQQLEMMGPGAFDLWQSGRLGLRDFVHTYNDDVYGEMTRQASLVEIMRKL